MKKTLSILFLCLAISSSFSGCGGSGNTTASQQKESKLEQKAPSPKTVSKDNTQAIKSGMGIDDDTAKKVDAILLSVGINDLTKIDGTPSMGYMIESPLLGKAIAVAYGNEAKEITKIVYKNVTLYENGKVLSNISSGNLTNSEKHTAMNYAEREVKKILKDPASAKFPGSYWVSKSNNIISVVGYVDAKNSFNSMVKSKFRVDFNKDWKVEGIEVDGL